MKRICPKCENVLKDHECYFCHNCGEKLDDHLIKRSVTFIPKTTYLSSEKSTPKVSLNFKNLNKNVQLALGIIISLFILSTLAFFITRYISKPEKDASTFQNATGMQRVYVNSVDIGYSNENIVFGSNDITKYVPVNVDFYIEGVNLNEFIEVLTGKGELSYFKDNFGIESTSRFALFGKNYDDAWRYAIVLDSTPEQIEDIIRNKAVQKILEDPDIKESTDSQNIEVRLNGDLLTLEIIGSKLIITNYTPFIQEIIQSSTGIAKNVTHNPKYSSYSAFLPQSGQLIVMNFLEDFDSLYDLLKTFNIPQETDKILAPVIEKKYVKFVIRKNER